MKLFRQMFGIVVGLFAGLAAFCLMKEYQKRQVALEGEAVEAAAEAQPEEEAPAAQWKPVEAVQYPTDTGRDTPNVNPVTLGSTPAPKDANGKFDPTKIASAEDFGDWDDLGCQG